MTYTAENPHADGRTSPRARPRYRPPSHSDLHATSRTHDNWIEARQTSCRQQTAPPQHHCSKDVTLNAVLSCPRKYSGLPPFSEIWGYVCPQIRFPPTQDHQANMILTVTTNRFRHHWKLGGDPTRSPAPVSTEHASGRQGPGDARGTRSVACGCLTQTCRG
jgi:hypothetical protein